MNMQSLVNTDSAMSFATKLRSLCIVFTFTFLELSILEVLGAEH